VCLCLKWVGGGCTEEQIVPKLLQLRVHGEWMESVGQDGSMSWVLLDCHAWR
jgi:hypothetical protein